MAVASRWRITTEWITGDGVRIPEGAVMTAAPLTFQVDPDWATLVYEGRLHQIPDELIVEEP